MWAGVFSWVSALYIVQRVVSPDHAHQLHSAFQSQFLEDIVYVALHGVLRDIKLVGNAAIAIPLQYEIDYLTFTSRYTLSDEQVDAFWSMGCCPQMSC